MPNQEDGVGEAVAKNMATMEDLKKLESSMGSKLDAMMAILQEMKLNSIPTTLTAPPLVPAANTPLEGISILRTRPKLRVRRILVRHPLKNLRSRRITQRFPHRLGILRSLMFPCLISFLKEPHQCLFTLTSPIGNT